MARLESNTCPALSDNVVAKLNSRNICSVYDFMLFACDDLMKYTGLSFKEIECIRESFTKKFGGEMADPIQIYREEKENSMTTGIKQLDNLLGGGLRCRGIYEICGPSSAGKSQICHWISIKATLNESTVHYIDCGRNFSTARIQMILEAKQCNDFIIGTVMSNIKVHQIYKAHELFTILHHLSSKADDVRDGISKKLVIVDSLSSLCATIAKNELSPFLCNYASVCRYLVNNFSAIVINVNTIKVLHKGNAFSDQDTVIKVDVKPSLGNYWLNIPNVRLLITCMNNAQREISVWNSCQLENGKKCFVNINDNGIS